MLKPLTLSLSLAVALGACSVSMAGLFASPQCSPQVPCASPQSCLPSAQCAPKFCMPARGNEKPYVETRVRVLQQQWSTPVPRAADLDDLAARGGACAR